MNSVLQELFFVKHLSTYEEWLAGPADETGLITNGDVINGVVLDGIRIDQGNKPSPHWLNPFTATQDEIDQARATFDGTGVEWRDFVSLHCPTLNPQTEYNLKISLNAAQDIAQCGTIGYRNTSNGDVIPFHKMCNRRGCPHCDRIKEEKIFKRYMACDGDRFILTTDKKVRANLIDKYGKANVFAKNLDATTIVVVIRTDDMIGQEMTEQYAKEFCKLPPPGTKMSGDLGKPAEPTPEQIEAYELSQGGFVGEVNITHFDIVAAPEVIEEIIDESLVETFDLNPGDSAETLQDALDVIIETIKGKCFKYCVGFHYLYKKQEKVYGKNLDWSGRQTAILTRLRR